MPRLRASPGPAWQRRPAAGPCWASGWKPLPLSLGLHGRRQRHPAAGCDPARAETGLPRLRREGDGATKYTKHTKRERSRPSGSCPWARASVAAASRRWTMLGKRLEAASTFTRPSWSVAAASVLSSTQPPIQAGKQKRFGSSTFSVGPGRVFGKSPRHAMDSDMRRRARPEAPTARPTPARGNAPGWPPPIHPSPERANPTMALANIP